MSGFHIGGQQVEAGSRKTVELEVSLLANSTRMNLPVHVVHGARPGPTMFASGVIHGDEIQGVEIIRRILAALKVEHMAGTLLAVPIVNSFGFLNHSRYMPDRRDLNREFPGSERGSLASLLAELFFTDVVKRAQFGIDFHTAALHRSNLPQIRIAPEDKDLAALAEAFSPPVILTSKLRDGSLRQCAKAEGIKVLLYEGGEALRFDEAAIDVAVKGTLRMMQAIGMIDDAPKAPGHHAPVQSSSSTWLRAPDGGILHSVRRAGDRVGKGEPVGVISDPLGAVQVPVLAEDDGIIIGRTNLPIVNRGDALFHVARIKMKSGRAIQPMADEDEII
ncbi:MAG: succinylglutamate desuccinylase/aspartoacylase family protein [Alphaproteobacteria bacterium]|nr:succinylglutamate desuccinylase/aspartoacylase family protein [Alphaproteobacteria bacterium]